MLMIFAIAKLEYQKGNNVENPYFQWSFLVPLIGGRYHIIPKLAGTIPLIYHLYIALPYFNDHLVGGFNPSEKY